MCSSRRSSTAASVRAGACRSAIPAARTAHPSSAGPRRMLSCVSVRGEATCRIAPLRAHTIASMLWVARRREALCRCGRRARWALVVALLACAPGVAAAAADPPDPGQTTSGTVTSGGAEYPYLLYTPASYTPGRAAPLLVMVHGCQTTAEQQMKANLYNPIAEREGFVVLYPDVDATGRAQPGPTENCWKFPDPQAWTRDSSDAGAIADMTRAVMRARAIDPERVYLIGMSAGGFMASIEAAAYPDLYAAIGISAAGAYADAGCTGTGTGMPVELSSQMAFDEMGPRARIVPRMVIGGDADQGIPPACADKALE